MPYRRFGEDVLKIERKTVTLQWAMGDTIWIGELPDGTRGQYLDLDGQPEAAQQALYQILKAKQARSNVSFRREVEVAIH